METSALVDLSHWKRLSEVPLRSSKAKLATQNGFRVSMFYVALDTAERHIERVMRRAARGGHSASETTLRRIHALSLGNLPTALIPDQSGIEIVQVYDNSRTESRPSLVLEAGRGSIVRLAVDFPEWLGNALGWTEHDLERHRRELMRRPDIG